MPRPRSSQYGPPKTVKFPREILAEIKRTMRLLRGFSEQDTIRLAVEIGLGHLRLIDYKVGDVINAAANAIKSVPPPTPPPAA